MRVLVTGSDGFIGKHVMKRFDDVVGIDRKSGVDMNTVGFNDVVLEYRPEVIIHLGASCSTSKSIKDPRTDFIDNVMGTFNVLEMARQVGAKIHFTSSIKAGTGTPYGVSKECGELYINDWTNTYDMPRIINRPSTIYGEGQDGSEESGWIGWFIKASLTNQPITIYGDGTQVRRILHVDDYVDFIVEQVNNFGDWQGEWVVDGGVKGEVTLLNVLEYLGYKNYSFKPARSGDVHDYVRGENLANIWWEKGIDRTIKYYEEIL